MKLTVDQVFEAMNALVAIANKPRIIPGMAKFKLAKMHDALAPTFEKYRTQYIELTQKYGSEKFADPEKKVPLGWGCGESDPGYATYKAEWDAIVKQELEIEITPITTDMLGNDPHGLEIAEYKQLGGLVIEQVPT